MATLQKLRNNKITPIAIGVAMLLFIVTLFISNKGGGQGERDAASLNGKTLDITVLNQMVEEAKDAMTTMGQIPDQLTNDQMTQLREMVYQNYIQNQLLEEECEKLGITVTDAELQNIIKTGNNQLLQQTPFSNQQGGFDYAALQQFLKQYNEIMGNPQAQPEQREYADRIYRLWIYIEKQLRKNVLMEKYQVLLSSLVISNPVAAKASFDGRTNETDVLLAALPYTSIEDKDVTVEESDIKAKYNEFKEFFYQAAETRDIKYIDVTIKASAEDEAALNKEMAGFAEQLRDSSVSAESVVRRSQSSVAYSAVPVSKKAFPSDIAARFDSLAVGTQTEPYYNIADNTMNIIKMMGKVSRPDSIEVREIAATGADLEAAKKTADSIYTALQNGANFDTIAKAYNQPATKHWITSAMYEGSEINEENQKYLTTVTTASVNSLNKIELGGGVIIAQVTDRRNMEDKYDVAVIKRELNFSNKTTNDNYNKLSTFIASNKTVKEMEDNAKGEFIILPRTDIEAMTPALPGIEDSREAIRWAYNEDTKVGDVSEIFYCGKKREHLVVAVLTAINEEGYRDIKDEQVNNMLRSEVIQDKKAAKLQEKMQSAKSIADVAKIAGAIEDTVQHITFSAPAYIQKMGAASEPAVSGAVSAAAQGKFVAGVRGNAGVYAFQVLAKNKSSEQFDEKSEMQRAAQQNMYVLRSMFQSDLRSPMNIFYNNYKNAKKKDNRNLFF